MPDTEIPNRGLDIGSSEDQWGFTGNNYLFVIGIDDYEHWAVLNCAVKDIEDFTDVLLDRYKFKKEHVFSLKNEEATEQRIRKGFKEIKQVITEKDNLVVYFSGHGHYDPDDLSGYWIPVNARHGDDYEYEYIDTLFIADRLQKINSLHTFLIIDACFSGTMVTQLKSSPRAERYKSRKIFTSGRAEVVSDGPAGGNSPFAEGILMTLRKNLNPYLRASEFIVDVTSYVEKQVTQTPIDGTLLNAKDEGGDFVFHLKNSKGLELPPIDSVPEDRPPRDPDPMPEDDELVDWIVLQNNETTYKQIKAFIEKYPKTRFLKKAQKALKKKDDVAYNAIKFTIANGGISLNDKKNACEVYLKNYPEAKNEKNVRRLLNDLHFESD